MALANQLACLWMSAMSQNN